MNEAVIKFENVTKVYPLYHNFTLGFKRFLFNLPKTIKTLHNTSFEALKDVSFQIYKGESVGIIGKNGAGKSTLLSLIAGVIEPTKGKITVKGRVLPLLEIGSGFHPELTGRENIILYGILIGLRKNEVLEYMDEIIEFSGIGEFIDQPIKIYSSGMIMRLAFSTAMIKQPDILLIDEVLAVGDIDFQKKCIEKIKSFKQNGTTIVLVTHFPEQVIEFCNWAILLENHRIKMIGKPDDVVKEYLRT